MATLTHQISHNASSNGGSSHNRPMSAKSDDTWSTYNFDWLFDPNRFDHLPIEEQLKLYKQRDLKKGKIYKIASSIWGAPRSRKRKIVAPPMFAPLLSDSQEELAEPIHLPPSFPTQMNAELKPRIIPEKLPSKAEIKVHEEEEKVVAYKSWINKRKTFRNNLESMGLNEDWLTRKPDKTPLEQRVLRRLMEERNPRIKTPPPKLATLPEVIVPEESPLVKRPSPVAIRIIEKFLHDNKMRLIDLFVAVDKDKNWKVSRDEFRKAIQEADIPISEVLLEDLILALDTDLNDELDYRELAKGMGLWKIEKRESKKKLLASDVYSRSPTKYSQMSGFESPEKEKSLGSMSKDKERSQNSLYKGKSDLTKDNSMAMESSDPNTGSPQRIKSALSTISSSSSQYLEVPESDMRAEQMILSSEEAMVDLRKRDREALARMMGKKLPSKSSAAPKKGTKHSSKEGTGTELKTMVKTGDQLEDHHCQRSTLDGETGQLVDQFRQLKFKEYTEICRLCKENHMPFTEDLLRKVLLFPPDKPRNQLRKQIRQPGQALLTTDFTKKQKRPKTPVKEEHKVNTKASKSGSAMLDSRSAYPSRTNVAATPVKVRLSTGRAVVRRQVDCWMTFEEYDHLTKNLGVKYSHLHGRTSDNAFWPGHMLDKIRLCVPGAIPQTSTLFQTVKQPPRSNVGYHNDLRTWPVNDGYVQMATIDKY